MPCNGWALVGLFSFISVVRIVWLLFCCVFNVSTFIRGASRRIIWSFRFGYRVSFWLECHIINAKTCYAPTDQQTNKQNEQQLKASFSQSSFGSYLIIGGSLAIASDKIRWTAQYLWHYVNEIPLKCICEGVKARPHFWECWKWAPMR